MTRKAGNKSSLKLEIRRIRSESRTGAIDDYGTCRPTLLTTNWGDPTDSETARKLSGKQ